jgi:hypothetical protein
VLTKLNGQIKMMEKGYKMVENNFDGNKKIAKTSGLFYLLFILTSIFADVLAHVGFGDTETIFNTIITHEKQFTVGITVGLFSSVFFLFAAWFLYKLLKSVNKNIALLFLLLNFGGVIIQCLSILNLIAGIKIVNGENYLNVIQVEQLQAQSMFYINLYKSSFNISQIFYGAWTLPLGYLVYKSKFIPKIFGIFLMIDCFAILMYFLQSILVINNAVVENIGYVISAVAEFSFTFWLLMRLKNPPPLAVVMY